MLSLFCVMLSLFAPFRHITVPEGTEVLVIEVICSDCDQQSHADFVRCMRGPVCHCYNVTWSSNPELRVWVCSGLPPICVQFDEDGDRDVDLHDYAVRMRRLSAGVRRERPIDLTRVARP